MPTDREIACKFSFHKGDKHMTQSNGLFHQVTFVLGFWFVPAQSLEGIRNFWNIVRFQQSDQQFRSQHVHSISFLLPDRREAFVLYLINPCLPLFVSSD